MCRWSNTFLFHCLELESTDVLGFINRLKERNTIYLNREKRAMKVQIPSRHTKNNVTFKWVGYSRWKATVLHSELSETPNTLSSQESRVLTFRPIPFYTLPEPSPAPPALSGRQRKEHENTVIVDGWQEQGYIRGRCCEHNPYGIKEGYKGGLPGKVMGRKQLKNCNSRWKVSHLVALQPRVSTYGKRRKMQDSNGKKI